MSKLAPLLRKKSALQIKMLDKEFSSSLLPPFYPQPDGLAGPLLLTIRGEFTINLCLGICLCILHCKECSPLKWKYWTKSSDSSSLNLWDFAKFPLLLDWWSFKSSSVTVPNMLRTSPVPMLDSMDSQRGDLFLGLALLGPIVNLLIALDLRKIYQDNQNKINVHLCIYV